MGRTGRIMIGLVSGLAFGLVARSDAVPGLEPVAAAIGTAGQLWLNALQMTLVPLIFCLMAGGVGSVVRQASAGRTIAVTVALFAGLSLCGALCGALISTGLLALWTPSRIGTALAAGWAAAPPATPGFVAQLLALIPVNPVAAAAQAAWLPLIVFASIFGAAIARLPEGGDQLFGLLRIIADALLLIVEWVLRLAPAGVFMLACGAAVSVGAGLATTLFQYVALLSLALAGALSIALLIGIAGSGASPHGFLKAVSGPLAIAASTQSSMASLPALLRAATDDLRLPAGLVAAVMPLAVSTFRFGNVFGSLCAGLIGAALCGLHPDPAHIVMACAIAVLTNVGVIGLPGAAVLFAAYGPVFAALGTPIQLIALLIPVFTLPDILDTSANVVADLSATAIIARIVPQQLTAKSAVT